MKRISIGEYINNYTKFLTDLTNVDEIIKDEDKALIMLSSLLDDEYETFVLTLINGKSSLYYDEVSATLVNYELRRKDKKSSSSTSAEVLAARGWSSNQKGKGDREELKFKSGNCNLGRINVRSLRRTNTEKRLSKARE